MTYYNGTLFPSEVQSFPLQIDELKLLQRRDPIKFGEALYDLKRQGLKQNEISEKLSLNRHLVGRYLRMAQWDTQLKDAIKASKSITNTMLLKAASTVSALGELKELLQPVVKKEPTNEAVSAPVTEPMSPHKDDSRWTPFFNGVTQCAAAPNVPISEMIPEPYTTQVPPTKKHVSPWLRLLNNVSHPYTLFLGCISVVLTAFLVHQGYLFFSSIEEDWVSAFSSAVISELIPFAAAIMLAMKQPKILKLLLTLILLGCISGLAGFMHASLALRMNEHSQLSKQARIDRSALEQSLAALGQSLSSLPSSHVSKRQAVVTQMGSLQKELRISAVPVYGVLQDSNARIQLAFSVWLRVAAMLVNAIVIHHLVSQICLRGRV